MKERFRIGAMQEVPRAVSDPETRAVSRRRGHRLVATVLVAAAAVTLVLRLPDAFRGFDDQAAKNAVGGAQGRLLATADSIDVDNDFVLAAVNTLPPTATYTLQVPPNADVAASSYGIGALTISALPGYMRFMLLPRREVAPEKAEYVLCYACDTSPWDHKTSWLWKNAHAVVIGKVSRS
jgi:hypothetical protein